MKQLTYYLLLLFYLCLPQQAMTVAYSYEKQAVKKTQKKKRFSKKRQHTLWQRLFKKTAKYKKKKKSKQKKSYWEWSAFLLGLSSFLSLIIAAILLVYGPEGVFFLVFSLVAAIWVLVKRKKLKRREGKENVSSSLWKWGHGFSIGTITIPILLLFYFLFLLVFVG